MVNAGISAERLKLLGRQNYMASAGPVAWAGKQLSFLSPLTSNAHSLKNKQTKEKTKMNQTQARETGGVAINNQTGRT